MDGKRYRILDDIRGAAVLSMIAYHFVWDLVYIAGIDMGWYRGIAGILWQRSICCAFIVLSGFCWRLGRRKLRRGLTVFAAGGVVTAATLIAMPENAVICGILTLLGSCMLLMIPMDRSLRRVPAPVGFSVCLILYMVMENAWQGKILRGLVRLPEFLYRNLFTAFLGFPDKSFFSTDYFPLIPWAFLFVAGYYLYEMFRKQDWLRLLEHRGLPPLEWVGRNALIIYLLHQPLLMLGLGLFKII